MGKRRGAGRRSKHWAHALSLSAAAASLTPGLCRADDEPFVAGALSWGLGFFLGYQFAANPGRAGFEWGLETYATHRFGNLKNDCDGGTRAGVGPGLQLSVDRHSSPRLTLAMHVGTELARGTAAIIGEAGVSYRFGDDPGASVHLGVVPEVFLLAVPVRHQLLRGETFWGGGLRYLPTFGELGGSCTVAGRPLRDRAGRRAAVSVECADLTDDARAAAAAYAADAQAECTSISAFVQLAHELAVARAPVSLIARALQAADDERRHTLQCTHLAQQLGATEVRCVAPLPQLRAASSRRALLERLALESYEDGCVTEAAAAAQLWCAARVAADSSIARQLRSVARDEDTHTQLAWDILDFCIAAGDEPVRRAVMARAEATGRDAAQPSISQDLLRYGRLPPHALAQLTREQAQAARSRVRAAHSGRA
jgi:hypothetical protein